MHAYQSRQARSVVLEGESRGDHATLSSKLTRANSRVGMELV